MKKKSYLKSVIEYTKWSIILNSFKKKSDYILSEWMIELLEKYKKYDVYVHRSERLHNIAITNIGYDPVIHVPRYFTYYPEPLKYFMLDHEISHINDRIKTKDHTLYKHHSICNQKLEELGDTEALSNMSYHDMIEIRNHFFLPIYYISTIHMGILMIRNMFKYDKNINIVTSIDIGTGVETVMEEFMLIFFMHRRRIKWICDYIKTQINNNINVK